MNRKAIFIALIFSLGVAFVLNKYIQQKGAGTSPADAPIVQPPPPKILTAPVVVAKKRVSARTRIDGTNLDELFAIEERPVDFIATGTYTVLASLTNTITAMTVLPGDAITEDRILKDDQFPSLSHAIPKGYRAVSIAVSKVSSVGGFVQQNDYVDVIATIRPKGGEPVSKIVLQDIKVLAVGSTYEIDQSLPSSTPAIAAAKVELVTLAVTPEQLERLMFLDSGTTFRLVLKHPEEIDRIVATRGATEKIVLDSIGHAPVKPAAEDTAVASQPAAQPQPVYYEPETGKVEIMYGTRRREEMYKYGSGERTVSQSFYRQPAQYTPPAAEGTKQDMTLTTPDE